MQERGINSTFKKIIYESSEMVFLADDTFPYSIFYGNESFESQIGESLEERNLVGLGLDINAYIFKEELILTLGNKDYSFRLELPQESGSNYFLFYKGKEQKTHGLPGRKEIHQFFKSGLDLIAIGQHDFLTYTNSAVKPILGYDPSELLNTSLCPFIHEQDLELVRDLWRTKGNKDQLGFFKARFKGKDESYRYLECSVQFTEEHFYLIGRDKTDQFESEQKVKHQSQIQTKANRLSKSGTWYLDSIGVHWDESAMAILPKDKSELSSIEFGLKSKLQEIPEGKESFQESLPNSTLELRGELINSISGNKQWIGVVIDTSERKELEDSVQLVKNLLKESPDALMVVHPDGKVFLCNDEARRLLGVESGQRFQHLIELNVIFEETDQWKDWINITGFELGSKRFSTLLINGNGKQLTLEIASKTFHDNGNDLVLLSFKNITEKVTLEKTLEANSDFLMNLTEQVPGGLYQLLLDENGKMSFSFLSKGISSVLGLSAQDIENFEDISVAISRVHPMDLPNVIMSSVASAKKQEPWQCQFRVKNEAEPTGYRWVLGAARPQTLENGDMVWYGYLTDISQQKEFETKLDEARKTAEKASQIKSDFLSMISHELRTPLNAISGSVYSLLQENPNEIQKNTLNTINFAVDNLIIMINDLLDFQKIEAGKLTIEKAPFNLKGLVEQVMKGLSFHARDSKNDMQLHLGDGLDLTVKGDKTRISQILNNLITNALKFTHDGHVDVSLQLKESSQNKVKVYFEVKDTGIGIAPENREKIFQDFDQVKPTFSTKYGGTGLGLSITRRLLSLMGGSIQLDSEVGKGSKFYFELEFDLATEKINHHSEFNGYSKDFSKLHLLMAEDNDVNALVLGKIIKKWGYTFERVGDGAQAVEAVKSNTYDCILMDIQMPVMDGFEATSEIKKISNTPVIALTAAAKLEIMEKINEIGFDGFVAKPIDAAELLKKIKEVIKEGQSS
ncbi:ATP-binding protein [Algoriphagus zhangzhouensis]|uniref:histidine kinase n=1 Tax=Algoriphagus zhangzhouensis TaxID=1073327 RepID=A0A1M7Z3P8_9BACT|nr:ATP-binding protein [Algoriphagus zhangzhouensis]TDY48398.1 PAS domain-containing protein [Algoriphagus zhangzhouensis]SHO59445.1 PAS domain-containing protein [Algoriphagus zhangzhouensis]